MLTNNRSSLGYTGSEFFSQAGVELNRAERYRVFVSLSVLDLSPFRDRLGQDSGATTRAILSRVREGIRACDYADLVDSSSLALLFPETSRQEAEIVAKRTAELVRQTISELTGQNLSETVPVEIASYPDTAGAKALAEFLRELAERSRN